MARHDGEEEGRGFPGVEGASGVGKEGREGVGKEEKGRSYGVGVVSWLRDDERTGEGGRMGSGALSFALPSASLFAQDRQPLPPLCLTLTPDPAMRTHVITCYPEAFVMQSRSDTAQLPSDSIDSVPLALSLGGERARGLILSLTNPTDERDVCASMSTRSRRGPGRRVGRGKGRWLRSSVSRCA